MNLRKLLVRNTRILTNITIMNMITNTIMSIVVVAIMNIVSVTSQKTQRPRKKLLFKNSVKPSNMDSSIWWAM